MSSQRDGGVAGGENKKKRQNLGESIVGMIDGGIIIHS